MKKTMKLAALLLCCVVMVGLMTGCVSKESEYTSELKNDLYNKYGFPSVENYFEYSQLKEIYEMRDNPDLYLPLVYQK